MFNFFTTSPPSSKNGSNVTNNVSMDYDRRNDNNNSMNQVLSKLPILLQRNIGQKLDYYLVNNKKKVLDIAVQSVTLLKRFINNISYIWIIYEDSLELLSCKNDNNDNDVKCTFRIKYDNSYGNYHKFQCIDTRDDENAFVAFHFIKGKIYNILPLDARHVLYYAEMVRLNEIPFEDSSSKVIPITDGTKAETGTIDIDSVRSWGINLKCYDNCRFSNLYAFSFSVTIVNASSKSLRNLSFISAIEHFVNIINDYGSNTFVNPNNLISFQPPNNNEAIILNDGNIGKFGKSNPLTMTLWEAAIELQTISSYRLQLVDNINIESDENKKRRVLLESLICLGLNSIVSEYIQGTYVNEETGAENYLLEEIVAVQQWAIGSNMPNNINIGGLNAPQLIDDIQTCSKLSLKEHLEIQIGNIIHTYVVPLLLHKNGPGIQTHAARDIHSLIQLKFNTLLNDIKCLESLVEALLKRKESQAETFLQETDAETEHDLIVEYINLKLVEIRSLSQVLQLCMISCQHPKVSLSYLLLDPQIMFSKESRRVRLDFKIKNWIPENIDLLGDERNQTYLFDELVARLEEPNCQARIKRMHHLSENDVYMSISELLLLPVASVRYSKNLENAKTQLSIAHSIIVHILLDSILSTMTPENIDLEIIDNFATDLGESANLSKNIQHGIVALWKIDHGIDLEKAVDDLCAPKVNISADVVMFYQITRLLLLSTEHKNFIPAKNFLIYFTPIKEVLNPVKGIIALSAAMLSRENWELGWHTARRLCAYLDQNSAREARKNVALLICKWSIYHQTLVNFLNTVMIDDEQLQVEEYLKVYTNHEINNRDENAPFVDVTVMWLLRLEKFDEASDLHNRHKESLRVASDRSSIEKRESIINNMIRFPSISKRNYNIFRDVDIAQKPITEVDMI